MGRGIQWSNLIRTQEMSRMKKIDYGSNRVVYNIF